MSSVPFVLLTSERFPSRDMLRIEPNLFEYVDDCIFNAIMWIMMMSSCGIQGCLEYALNDHQFYQPEIHVLIISTDVKFLIEHFNILSFPLARQP